MTHRATPFNRKEVTCYLLWVAIALIVFAIVAWLLFFAHAREPIHGTENGTPAVLVMPSAVVSPLA
jgi:hypothetical protein